MRNEAVEALNELREYVGDDKIVEYLVYNWMSGSDAAKSMEDAKDEFGIDG